MRRASFARARMQYEQRSDHIETIAGRPARTMLAGAGRCAMDAAIADHRHRAGKWTGADSDPPPPAALNRALLSQAEVGHLWKQLC